MARAPSQQVPGVYHRRIGDIVVSAVSDGYLDGSVEAMQNISADEARSILRQNFRPGRRTSINCYLIHSGGRLALVETGCGDYLQPSAGKLQGNLAAAGVDPSDIDTIILTHMHPDHSAGLTNRKTGDRWFPNAELVMHESEMTYWMDDREMGRADEQARRREDEKTLFRVFA